MCVRDRRAPIRGSPARVGIVYPAGHPAWQADATGTRTAMPQTRSLLASLLMLVTVPAGAAGGPLAEAGAALTRSYAVPGWALALLLLAAAVLMIVLARPLLGWLMPWRRYRADRFLGMVWRWRYRRGKPTGIWCYCPDDDTQLVYSYSQRDHQVVFHCETCGRDFGGFSGDHDYVRGMIYRQVARKLRTGEWEDNASSAAPADG